MSRQEHSLPNLLTLPSELRLKIFEYSLLPQRLRLPNSEDFNLLVTSRQIYHETRHLVSQLYIASLAYRDITPRLEQLQNSLRHDWQIVNLRRLEIRWLYPGHFPAFINTSNIKTQELTCDSSPNDISKSHEPHGRWSLFREPGLNLDILKIYTDDWLTKAKASPWRIVGGYKCVQRTIPGPGCEWLIAICQLQGFKQLEIVFSEGDLVQEYWERGRFIRPLLRNFATAVEVGRLDEDSRKKVPEGWSVRNWTHDGSYDSSYSDILPVGKKMVTDESSHLKLPEWTAWHKWTPDEDFGERITLLRTQDLHRHRYPQWGRDDVEVLRLGNACVHPRFAEGSVLVEGSSGRGGLFAEIPPPSFHVGELLGNPKGRKRFCEHCIEKEKSVSEIENTGASGS